MGILLDKIQKQKAADSADLRKASCEAISPCGKRAESMRKRKPTPEKSANPQTVRTPKPTPHKAFRKSANPHGLSTEYEKSQPPVQDADSINQSRLVSLAVQYCIDEHSLKVDPEEIAALVPPSDWHDTDGCSTKELEAWAAALAMRAVRYRGQVPAGWDQVAHCRHCGPVYSFVSGDCLACPWCEVMRAGKTFPAPAAKDAKS